MRLNARGFLAAALFASIASGQVPGEETVERVLRFVHAGTVQDVQEIAMVVRAIADIPPASVDPEQRTLALRATAGQIALAEWLVTQLDKPANWWHLAQQSERPVVLEYRVPGGGEDVVRVFHLEHTETVRDLQEVATVVRSMADIRRLFIYSSPRVMTLRGTASQVGFAEWLVNELDIPAGRRGLVQKSLTPAAREYRLPGNGDDVAKVYFLTHTATPQDLQEIATLVRAIGEIRRLFIYNAPKALALRGTTAQMALAEWLFTELDKPAHSPAPARQPGNPASPDYRMPGNSDDVVRVFYLAHADSAQRLQEIATRIRTVTEVRRLFTYNALKAVALRGTSSQLALAARLIRELDQ